MHNLTPSTLAIALGLLLSACTTAPPEAARRADPGPTAIAGVRAADIGSDVALYALGLIDTGYRFGGKNPDAGLDCSGMVAYVFDRAAGLRVSGSAAEIAQVGKPVERESLKPGDLVFFNTRNRPWSHVGIYIGDGRFVHAPATNGRVRVDRMTDRYYAQRFEAARSYFD
ncbi:MAG TPA: C40 family peptidase [Rhodocyclaceae bacterium]|nr:C40 family peptidase [Rhodocyclaceae bacterium]HMV21735.1 C40 family peptidase [Rhodocyclaceae bacterium]HMW76236.1 C40 family peptidase [Rhodocyclaceae bacterium]HNE42188.1 C40 family peptidase [Rhodocyclaceae bacterium]HNM22332.1 C40 family peptidase [Rhodocyclaceae bacterium]